MSVLVILMPPRTRLSARTATSAVPSSAVATEGLQFALSNDGSHIDSQGRAPAPLLPKADTMVLVLADADVAWHRVTLPKAPAPKMRAALASVLEDQLLDEEAHAHFAIAPRSMGGQLAWVAVVHRPWLASELARFESAGVSIDSVVPISWPGDQAHGHFYEDAPEAAGSAQTMLCYADGEGLANIRLAGSLAKIWLPGMLERPARWTATPAVAAPAERWLGASLSVLTDLERAVHAAQSSWNLRQFDLAPRRRGVRALSALGKQFMRPSWRPVRLGLGALVAVQLLGLNAWAWQQRQTVDSKRAAVGGVLRETFPQVRAVLDAPLQMQREVDTLRAAAGRPGETDLDSLLAAAAAAWPEGQGATTTLRFESGRLTLGAAGWSNEQIGAFRDRLRLAGLAVDAAEGRVTVSRGNTAVKAGT